MTGIMVNVVATAMAAWHVVTTWLIDNNVMAVK